MFKLDDSTNNYKNITHAFFLALAITIAEPSTILPLMIHHFSDSVILVGLFASLLRGGAITIQLYVAFYAQTYQYVLPYLGRVFLFRFMAWLSIGLSIYFIGENHKTITLILIGVGLFLFSFTAGFGAIYFKELQAKLFSKSYRGKSMASRQIAGSIASIISGGVAGYILSHYEAPLSYSYLFIASSLFMLVGFGVFMTINEPIKERVQSKEKNFKQFIVNAIKLFKQEKPLQRQTLVIFLTYSYYMALPFVILEANTLFKLSGWMVGGFITIQMIGSIIGSFFLWRNIDEYEKMLSLSFIFMIFAFTTVIFYKNIYGYTIVFLLYGVAIDGFKIAIMNLIIEIAPEEKRPIYTALQTNISSIGLFFPIVGGTILHYIHSYTTIYILTIVLLTIGLIKSTKLKILPT